MSASSDEENTAFGIFEEPEGYFQPTKPFTYQDVQLRNGQIISLRLVGHSPLWGHHLWQAARIVVQYLEDEGLQYLKDRSILEFGAAAALPSIVAAHRGASMVLATDYPESDLIDNIRFNLRNCPAEVEAHALGYVWGADPAPLKALSPSKDGFDTLILADLLFNHFCHEALLKSLEALLRRSDDSIALVFFTPYRPWLLEKDMAFFDLVRAKPDLQVKKIGEWKLEKVMFEEDRGSEDLRRTVFGFAVQWIKPKWPPETSS